MREIEKLSFNNIIKGEVEAAESILDKLNEVIDAVNALIITHPRIEESLKFRKELKESKNE